VVEDVKVLILSESLIRLVLGLVVVMGEVFCELPIAFEHIQYAVFMLLQLVDVHVVKRLARQIR
jgi:hypothetical protein